MSGLALGGGAGVVVVVVVVVLLLVEVCLTGATSPIEVPFALLHKLVVHMHALIPEDPISEMSRT